MYKNMIYWTIIVFVTFAYGNSADAIKIKDNKGGRILNRVSSDDEKLDRDSREKTYKEIEKELKKLLEEMKRLQKDAQKNIQKKILPLLKREIETLRRWLRELRPEDDNQEPVRTKNKEPHDRWVFMIMGRIRFP